MSSAPISGVLLAAGASRRFGDGPPKQLALVDGVPLVRRQAVLALQSGLCQVIIVIGKAADEVKRVCRGLDVSFVSNPRYQEGQSLSVKLGLAAVDARAAAAVFIPVDLPALTVELVDAIIGCYRESGGPIVVPTHQGERGAPVLIDRALFGELAQIEGDSGGRQIFPAHQEEIVELEIESPSPLEDLDTRADLAKLR